MPEVNILIPIALGFLFLLSIIASFALHQRWEDAAEHKARKLEEHYANKLDKINQELTRARSEKKQMPSQELSEFLADFKTHGYSFVRVDPDSVMLRSPRER